MTQNKQYILFPYLDVKKSFRLFAFLFLQYVLATEWKYVRYKFGYAAAAGVLHRLWLANLSEGACPNYLQISKKFFRVPKGMLNSKIRCWSLP